MERDGIFPQFFRGIGTGRDFCGSGMGEVWEFTPVSPSSVREECRTWEMASSVYLIGWLILGIFKRSVAMIQCIRSSSWTGYMLMKVRHDLPEVGFVKVPREDGGRVRVFVDVSTEHIVEFGQSQASVCLWWNVNSSSHNRWKLRGR